MKNPARISVRFAALSLSPGDFYFDCRAKIESPRWHSKSQGRARAAPAKRERLFLMNGALGEVVVVVEWRGFFGFRMLLIGFGGFWGEEWWI